MAVPHLFSKVVYFYSDKEMVATEALYDYFNSSVAPANRSISTVSLPYFSGGLLFELQRARCQEK